jgi:hypothetical protein
MEFEPFEDSYFGEEGTVDYNDGEDLMETNSVATAISDARSRRVTGEPLRQRVPYGTGIEAQRTAVIANYDISRSPILSLLRIYDISDDMKSLLTLIKHVLLSYPEGERPNPPSRTQRRMKRGLVQWLDIHGALIQRCPLNIYSPNQ